MNEPLAVDLVTAARMLGVGSTLLREMVARHQVPHVRIGRRVVIPVAELRTWVASQVVPVEEAP